MLRTNPSPIANAGTHYIAFDLFVGRWMVLDALRSGIPHLAVAWLLPVTLMAGPVGLTMYLSIVKPFCSWDLWPWTRIAMLRLLFAGVWVLSLSMTGWVLVFPASFRAGDWLGAHDASIEAAFKDAAARYFPHETKWCS